MRDAVVPCGLRVTSPSAAGISRPCIGTRKIPAVQIVQRLQQLLRSTIAQSAKVDPRTINPPRLSRVRELHPRRVQPNKRRTANYANQYDKYQNVA